MLLSVLMTQPHENKNTSPDPRTAALERSFAVEEAVDNIFNSFAEQAHAQGMDTDAIEAAAKEAFANGTLPRVVRRDTRRGENRPYGMATERVVFAAGGRIPEHYLEKVNFLAYATKGKADMDVALLSPIEPLPNGAIQRVFSPRSHQPELFTGDTKYINDTSQLIEAEIARAAEQAEQMRLAGLGHTAAGPTIQPPTE
jgi:hypothetical protein